MLPHPQGRERSKSLESRGQKKQYRKDVKIMKRTDFKQIIKLRSFWKIDRRKGNYELPNGEKLSRYVTNLVESQMKIDNLLIREDGDLCFGYGGNWNTDTKDFDDYTLMPAFENNETCSYDGMERRIKSLVSEIIG